MNHYVYDGDALYTEEWGQKTNQGGLECKASSKKVFVYANSNRFVKMTYLSM